jgi:hypothetical protein
MCSPGCGAIKIGGDWMKIEIFQCLLRLLGPLELVMSFEQFEEG